MGQKVNPHGLRVGVIQGWNAQWYASKKDFADFLVEDHKIREFIKRKYYTFGISKTTIDRAHLHFQTRHAYRHQGRRRRAA